MKNPMTNTTELNTPDSQPHDNIVKTVDLREDTTNTLELLAERPQVQIERFVKDNIKLSKKSSAKRLTFLSHLIKKS